VWSNSTLIKLVAHAVDGLDVDRLPGIRLYLLAQVLDVDVHRAFKALQIVAKDPVQKLQPGKGPSRFPGQHLQQLEFAGREVHDLAPHPHLVAAAINGQVAKAHLRRTLSSILSDPAQHRPHLGHQLAGAEGLGDVIIRTQIQADELVLLGGLGRKHDDGHFGLGSQDAADVEAVHLGQQQVQDDEIWPLLAGQPQGFQAIVGDEYPVAGSLQVEPDQVYDLAVVVHHQDPTLHHHLSCPPRLNCTTKV
jgi:hypothetical protein